MHARACTNLIVRWPDETAQRPHLDAAAAAVAVVVVVVVQDECLSLRLCASHSSSAWWTVSVDAIQQLH